MDIRRFDLDTRGLARVLGELEAKILEAVWSLDQPTVKDVTETFGPNTNVKTVMTVMNRMVEKGILRRERRGRAFYYGAVADRETFMADVANQVIAGLVADFRLPTLTHLIDTVDSEQLAELESLIRSRRGDEPTE